MSGRIVRHRVGVKPNGPAATGQRPNSVNMGGVDLERLLAELDGPPGSENPAAKNRDFVRWQFRVDGVRLRVEQSGGGGASSSAVVRVACRNLSRGGISILHGAYIHPGSAVTIFLINRNRVPTPIPGSIVRCRHVRGMVHEIGIKFTLPIDTREFVKRDPFSDCFSLEHVQPADLAGTVVAIDDSPMDLKLIQHYLRETQLRVRPASGKDEALALIAQGCDLVLCDYDLGEATLVDVVAEMRARGVSTPVIAVTADTSVQTRDRLIAAEASALLSKPMSQDLLLRALAEFLVVGSRAEALRSTLAGDDPNAVLVEAFVQQARQFGKRLTECIQRDDTATARSICLQIRGSAPMLGFAGLGKLADAAANAVASSQSIPDSVVPLRSLIAACERIEA
jgi:CheY-like chemotaxis protein